MNRKKYQVRHNYKNRHYGILIGSEGNKYESITITHTEQSRHLRNIRLTKNPNKNDDRPSYLDKQIRRFPKKSYSRKNANFKFIKSDKDKIDKLAKEKHKFKLWQ